MSGNNLSNLELKKQALEIELVRIQSDLDRTIDEVKEDVTNTFAPKTVIRKYPLPVLGAAVIIGFLIGKGAKKSIHKKNSKNSSEGVGNIVRHEMKNALTKRAIHMLLGYLDKKVSRLKEKTDDKTS
ncbi:MAG: hypothetical protein WD016_12035 [Balneolaceae bacterium]